jgi:hypothetical protein
MQCWVQSVIKSSVKMKPAEVELLGLGTLSEQRIMSEDEMCCIPNVWLVEALTMHKQTLLIFHVAVW